MSNRPRGRASLLIVWLAAGTVQAEPTRIAGVELTGTLLDDARTLTRGLELNKGETWDSAVKNRTIRRLDRLGYHARLKQRATDNGTFIELALTPHRVIRNVYVRGTSPLWEIPDAVFEEDIQRRLGFRPGQGLPEGSLRAARFSAERKRIEQFLARQSFYKAKVEIRVQPTSRPDWVNLVYILHKGPRYKLGEVGASGNSALSTEQIAEIVTEEFSWLFIDLPFTSERLKSAVGRVVRVYQDNDYPGIRVREDFDEKKSLYGTRARLGLTIRERRRVDITFEVDGDRTKALQASLRKVITVYESGSYDAIEIEASERQIEQHYQREGYFHARATSERNRENPEVETVLFRVERGPQLKVQAIDFSGAKAFPHDDLRDIIETQVYTFWNRVGLSTGGYATTKQLRQDDNRLLEYYHERGYPDALVRAETATHWEAFGRAGALSAAYTTNLNTDGALFVRFYVREGPHVSVASVEFDAETPFHDLLTPMIKHLALKPGSSYNPRLLKADQARLLRALSEAGYLYASVLEPSVTLRGGKATITYAIRWNTAVSFGEIFIRGNFKTSAKVIRDEITFAAGEPFDIGKLESTKKNLRSLGIFSSVQVGLIGIEEQSQTSHVVIRVEERYDDFGAVQVGGGWATDSKGFVSLSYLDQNLFGLAQVLELRGELGQEIRSASATHTDRRLLGTRFQLETTAFVRAEETERLDDLLTIGASLTLSRQLIERLTGFVRYEIRQVTQRKDLFRPTGPVDEPTTIPLSPRTGAMGPGFIYDWRDSPFASTCGWSAGARAKYASRRLGGTDEFIKTNVNGQLLLPLNNHISDVGRGCRSKRFTGPFRAWFTLVQLLNYSHGFPLGGDVVLPEVERYFAGGDTTVRGFEEDRLLATLVRTEISPGVEVIRAIPQGGNIRILHKAELWFPIWPESPILGLPLRGAFFLDSGVITNSLNELRIKDFRQGVGAAVRLVLPFGFLSFEYGVPLDPGPVDDPTGRLHLNFGAALPTF